MSAMCVKFGMHCNCLFISLISLSVITANVCRTSSTTDWYVHRTVSVITLAVNSPFIDIENRENQLRIHPLTRWKVN